MRGGYRFFWLLLHELRNFNCKGGAHTEVRVDDVEAAEGTSIADTPRVVGVAAARRTSPIIAII